MNWWNSTIDKLVYKKDREDPEKNLKGKFFIGSTLAFLGILFFSVIYYIFVLPEEITHHPELFYSNIIGIALIIGMIFIYKKIGGRNIIVNLITLLGFGGITGTYDFNGGIYSPDNMWGIIISSWVFLVANRASGFFWMILSLLVIVFFYYAEIYGFRDFKGALDHLNSDYFFYNYILAGLFLLSIIALYESSKRKFVNDLNASKAEIEIHKRVLEEQKEDILASISYAKRIQYAVLPNEESIYRNIPLSFIMYHPRDIVSGDFFWFHEIDRDNFILVCADCTGHGVPGAMMTVVGSSLLNQIVIENKFSSPSSILAELDNKINSTLKQDKTRQLSVQDGMDLALIKVNKSKKEFIFTSAKRPAIFFRNNVMQEFKGSKFSLGGMRMGDKKFEEVKINFQEDDMIYFYTDGITDQFGGPKGKKYSSKRFKETLQNIHTLSIPEQKLKLENTIEKWKGNLEQVDDILVMGIRF